MSLLELCLIVEDLTVIEELEPVLPSEEEIARREAEAVKRRQEQKQKDLEECFGFKVGIDFLY